MTQPLRGLTTWLTRRFPTSESSMEACASVRFVFRIRQRCIFLAAVTQVSFPADQWSDFKPAPHMVIRLSEASP